MYVFYMIFQIYPTSRFEVFVPLIIGIIIGTIIKIAVAVYISKDAQKRGMDSSIYIFLVCCCTGWLIGGAIYLISASNHPIQTDDFQQPSFSSSQSVQYGQPQTTYGQPQYQQTAQPPQPRHETQTTIPDVHMVFCPICGSQNQKNAKYCSHCGADLN